MNILALHGFLGRATDWNPLMDLMPPHLRWTMPSLFSPDSELNLNSFSEFSRGINQLNIQGPKILMGYSMGGRLALEVLKKNPDEWEALVLLSAHPGLEDSVAVQSRTQQVEVWKERFSEWKWSELISAWNSQPVLKNSEPLSLKEEDFDRTRLCQALENLSVNRQKFDATFMKKQRMKIWAFVGEQDKKYLEIYSRMENRGLIENLTVLQGLGHRILHDGADVLGAQLEAQLEL